MKIIRDTETDELYLETDIRDLDGDVIKIVNMEGFGATDIGIEWTGGITWKQFDKLKEAFELAEKNWRIK